MTEPGLIGTGLLAPIRLGDGRGRGVGAAEAVAADEVPAEGAGEVEGEAEGEALGAALADGPGKGEPPGDGGNDWAGQGPLARTGATDAEPSRTKKASALLSAGPTVCVRAVRRPGLGDLPEAGIHSFGPTGPVADHAFV